MGGFAEYAHYGQPCFVSAQTGLNNLLARISQAKQDIGQDIDNPSSEEKERIFSFVFCPDYGGYSMPNLQGCLPFPLPDFYEALNAANPKCFEEFVAVVGLCLAEFRNRKKAVASIRENGLEMTIHSFESLERLLLSYELLDTDVRIIIEDILNGRGRLNEWQYLALKSHEVPSSVLYQFRNIVSLPSEAASVLVASAILEASRLKLTYGYLFEEKDPLRARKGFVGPFFYINGKILSKKLPIGRFDCRDRFFDVDTSHMELFETLGLDGDYGNYPRGRVLYDNFHGRFVVYVDADLMNKSEKEEIKRHFGLDGQKTVFRRDEHYTHDGL